MALPVDMVSIGEPAPGFELPDQDGEPVALDDFEGRTLVLYFYPRADTSGCTTEAKGFRDHWEDFGERDVAVVGVSDDPPADNRAFKEKYDLPFPLLSDESGAVAAAYDSYGEKRMFGRTFDGVFRNTFVIGPDGTVEVVYTGVSPDGHADELLADLGA